MKLPDWINAEKWEEWLQYRKEIKKTMKPITIKKQILFLSKHKEDHEEILETSMMNGWQGLFPLRNHKSPTTTTNETIDNYFANQPIEAEVIND